MVHTAGVADLHLHTTASDGTCSVVTRIEQAKERNLEAIAITDHDCIDGDLQERVRTTDGVELITGVEVRADVSGTKIELLGFYVDPVREALQSALQQARTYRRERNREMVEAIADTSGVVFEYEQLAGAVDGMLGRPHLAQALVDAGAVDSIGEAFEVYLGTDGAAFVPMERVPSEELIEAIHYAGGVAVLAHPGRTRTDDFGALLNHLVDVGLDGIEVWYPYDDAPQSANYANIGVEEATTQAVEHELIRTGGSDCHGPGSGKFRIGDVRVPAADLDALRRRADELRAL